MGQGSSGIARAVELRRNQVHLLSGPRARVRGVQGRQDRFLVRGQRQGVGDAIRFRRRQAPPRQARTAEDRPAAADAVFRLQSETQAVPGRSCAACVQSGVRLRVGQPQHVLRPVSSRRQLLRELGASGHWGAPREGARDSRAAAIPGSAGSFHAAIQEPRKPCARRFPPAHERSASPA